HIERAEVPIRIAIDDIPEVIVRDRKNALRLERPPSLLAAWFQSRKDLLMCSGTLERAVHCLRGIDLRPCQATLGRRALAHERRRIEMSLARILDDAVLHPVELVAGFDHRSVEQSETGLRDAARRVF